MSWTGGQNGNRDIKKYKIIEKIYLDFALILVLRPFPFTIGLSFWDVDSVRLNVSQSQKLLLHNIFFFLIYVFEAVIRAFNANV